MIVEQGHGTPLVLIPGIQGRWEYMRPAVDALSDYFRVITFPLCGERVSAHAFDASRGLVEVAAAAHEDPRLRDVAARRRLAERDEVVDPARSVAVLAESGLSREQAG